MTQRELETEWIGHDLFDIDGDRIGTVEKVLFADSSDDPEWLVVKTGVLEPRRVLVPAIEVRRAGERLTVLRTRERVKDAPTVDGDRYPTEAEKQTSCRHYGLQYVPQGASPAEGCAEMEDKRPGG